MAVHEVGLLFQLVQEQDGVDHGAGFLGGVLGMRCHGYLTPLANAAWICTFVWGSAPAVWVSTVFIAALEACLIAIYLRANCWREKRASLLEFVAVDVAFSAYLGWVTVRSRDLSLRSSARARAETLSECLAPRSRRS